MRAEKESQPFSEQVAKKGGLRRPATEGAF
jgi:hypothetical protein